jgi:hypothetical protein
MGRRASQGDRYIARTSAKIYGTSDEGSNHATTVKHQSSEVPSTCGGDQRILRGSDGATQVSMGPNLRGLFISWSEYEESHPFK